MIDVGFDYNCWIIGLVMMLVDSDSVWIDWMMVWCVVKLEILDFKPS